MPLTKARASTWPPATQRWCLSSLQLACGSSLAGAIEPPLKGRSYGTYSVLTGEWGFDGKFRLTFIRWESLICEKKTLLIADSDRKVTEWVCTKGHPGVGLPWLSSS